MTYITKEYDFHDAIFNGFVNVRPDDFNILNTKRITDSQYEVKTTHGIFICESFENDEATVYMRVTPLI
jgi:hypothetical protein